MKWVEWPRVKEKEGALLNHEVAGPQCQENMQSLYEKYDRYNKSEWV
jgi:hypothetical protein